MNILIYVMSLLMMLTLLTYGRLEIYRSFVITQKELERYRSRIGHSAIDNGAKQWYAWTTFSSQESSKKNSAPKEASPLINLYWLLHPEARNFYPQVEATYRNLLKKIIHHVFGEQTNFKEALNINPQLVDDLIQAIEAAGHKLALENNPIKTKNGLENLDLGQPFLQDIYYSFLKGYNLSPPVSLGNKHFNLPTENINTLDSSEIGKSLDEGFEEYKYNAHTISLLDFVTLNPQKTKIRVYLAPKAILLAIFGDPSTVEEILQQRISLYYQVKKAEDNQLATEQFKHAFAARAINMPETMLDFTVTATDPRHYKVP